MTAPDTRKPLEFLEYSHTIGALTAEDQGFYYPMDTTIGNDGRIYTVSRAVEGYPRGVRVTMCRLDSEYLGTFATFGESDRQLIWPTAIAMDSQGQIYVCDDYTNRITVFDNAGKYLDKWGVHGSESGELDGPAGLAFDREDNLYVSDHRNDRIQKFTTDGRFLSRFGSGGSGDGQFNLPWGLTVDSDGDVYVADWRNDRIQKFSPGGEFLAKYGSSGRDDGQFYRPSGVAVDGEGYMYVADWGNERLQVLDPKGGFLMKLRGQATPSPWAEDFLRLNVEEADTRAKSDLEPEIDYFVDDPHEESSHIEKLFWAPVSVKLDAHGMVYVTESNRHRIQIYKRGS